MSDTCVSSGLDRIMWCTRKLCLLSRDRAVCFGMSAT